MMMDKVFDVRKWEEVFIDYFLNLDGEMNDGSHDLSHFRRVYHTAAQIADDIPNQTDPLVILASAYFHDIVSLPKNHPDNNKSSRYAAIKAREILQSMGFPQDKLDSVAHAIEAHSFSAGIPPQTLEAEIIQDADRMESLGALGVMRTFYVSGRLGRPPYDPDDLYAKRRPLDDKNFGLDHFYVKLFKLPSLLKTEGGRCIARKRTEFLHDFIDCLDADLAKGGGGALAIVEACCKMGGISGKLFDPTDPFAKNRPLDTAGFAVDQIMKASEKFPGFITKFLDQLQNEIEPFILIPTE